MNNLKNIASFEVYCDYSSGNYGVNALCFSLGGIDVYFSYKTPVAYRTIDDGLVCRVNEWGPTTGKHLNAIEPNKRERVSGTVFERKIAAALAALDIAA